MRKDGAVKRNLLIGTTFVVAIVGLVVAERALEQTAAAQAKTGAQVPIFEVDPVLAEDHAEQLGVRADHRPRC